MPRLPSLLARFSKAGEAGVPDDDDDDGSGFSLEHYDVRLAETSEQREKEKGLRQCIREEWPLILCSVGFSTAIIMEGYSMSLMTGLFAFESFRHDFGEFEKGRWEIPYHFMATFPGMAQIGQQVGIAMSSFMIGRLGFRWTQLLCLFASTVLTFIPFYARNMHIFVVAFTLQGIPWGIYQVVGPGYSADVASLKLRPILLASNNLAWALGQLVGSISLYFFQRVDGPVSYRGPFAIQWAFCAILLVWTLLVPETSYWELQHDKLARARRSLKRLLWRPSAARLDEKMAQMAHNIHQERHRREEVAAQQAAASAAAAPGRRPRRRTFRQRFTMFSGVDARRTEIAIATWVIQATCGSALAPWCPVFLQRAGLSTEQAFLTNVGMCGIAVAGTLLSWVLMCHAGRRTIYAAGLLVLSVALGVLGGLGFAPHLSGWVPGGLLILIAGAYQLTVGPVCYSIVAEIPAITLRPQTLATARFFYNIAVLAQHALIPRMLKRSGWDLGARSGLPFAVTAALGLAYTLLRIPETRELGPRQLDILFENKVSARHFSAARAAHLDASTRGPRPPSPPSDSVVVTSDGTKSSSGLTSQTTVESKDPAHVLHVEAA